MNTLTKHLTIAALGVLLLIAGTSQASAAVIYSQTFTGSNATLVGATSTTGNGTWAGDNIVNLNGNTVTTPGLNGAVSLAFTPSNGFIYDLTATMNVTAADYWLGVGFLPANSVYSWFPGLGSVALQEPTVWQIWPQAVGVGRTSNDVTVRLDTTGVQWTTSMYQGGVQMGSTFTYTTNPTITGVGFVMEGFGSGVTGNVSAFELTSVPEPSTWTMLSLGLMSILFFRRRREA